MKVDTVQFNSPCLLEAIDDGAWVVHRPFHATVYFVDAAPEEIVVPEGFITDLASVPRFPGMFMLFGGKARRSAVIHDYLYSKRRNREFADDVFFAAMRHEEPAWRRAVMWLGVRLGGWVFYFTKEKST